MHLENNDKSIGIFDSGVGGLTVVKEILNLLPNENLVYLGDTARVPYGTKSKSTVIKYAESNANFLLSRGIKILVVACNTASAYSLEKLKENISIPVIGVIEPGAKKAASSTRNGNIAVIGTPSTIRSNAYSKALHNIDPKLKVFSKACPLFVALAEEGWHQGEITRKIIETYLDDLLKENIDVMILGCTHYPLLKSAIKEVAGENVLLIDSAEETAKEINEKITTVSIENNNENNSKYEFYLTDDSESFVRIAGKFLGREISEIKLTDL
jgi:glutamate racemase